MELLGQRTRQVSVEELNEQREGRVADDLFGRDLSSNPLDWSLYHDGIVPYASRDHGYLANKNVHEHGKDEGPLVQSTQKNNSRRRAVGKAFLRERCRDDASAAYLVSFAAPELAHTCCETLRLRNSNASDMAYMGSSLRHLTLLFGPRLDLRVTTGYCVDTAMTRSKVGKLCLRRIFCAVSVFVGQWKIR
jgi:hypothetical protein